MVSASSSFSCSFRISSSYSRSSLLCAEDCSSCAILRSRTFSVFCVRFHLSFTSSSLICKFQFSVGFLALISWNFPDFLSMVLFGNNLPQMCLVFSDHSATESKTRPGDRVSISCLHTESPPRLPSTKKRNIIKTSGLEAFWSLPCFWCTWPAAPFLGRSESGSASAVSASAVSCPRLRAYLLPPNQLRQK